MAVITKEEIATRFSLHPIWIEGMEFQYHELAEYKRKGEYRISMFLDTVEQKKTIHDIVNRHLDDKETGKQTVFYIGFNEHAGKPVYIVGTGCSGEADFGGMRVPRYRALYHCTLNFMFV